MIGDKIITKCLANRIPVFSYYLDRLIAANIKNPSKKCNV